MLSRNQMPLLAARMLGLLAAANALVTSRADMTPVVQTHARATSNNPNLGAKAAYADELHATAHTSGIQVLRDDPQASILQRELGPGCVEWVVFNPEAKPITLEGFESIEPYLYRTMGRP